MSFPHNLKVSFFFQQNAIHKPPNTILGCHFADRSNRHTAARFFLVGGSQVGASLYQVVATYHTLALLSLYWYQIHDAWFEPAIGTAKSMFCHFQTLTKLLFMILPEGHITSAKLRHMTFWPVSLLWLCIFQIFFITVLWQPRVLVQLSKPVFPWNISGKTKMFLEYPASRVPQYPTENCRYCGMSLQGNHTFCMASGFCRSSEETCVVEFATWEGKFCAIFQKTPAFSAIPSNFTPNCFPSPSGHEISE